MTRFQQLRKGSTPFLILGLLSRGKMYGYQIMREVELRSGGYFSMTAALLYPALHQLEQDGLVESEWQALPGQRRRKYYTLTSRGAQVLEDIRAEWLKFAVTLFRTLEPAPGKPGKAA